MFFQIISALRIQNEINEMLINRLGTFKGLDVKPVNDLIELLRMQIKELDKTMERYLSAKSRRFYPEKEKRNEAR